MKTLTLTAGLGFLLLLMAGACQTPQQDGDERTNPLVGTWQAVHNRISTPDTTIERSLGPDAARAVINETHFAIGAQAGDAVWGVGGRYTYDGTTYREIIQYHGRPEYVGDTITLGLRFEGDKTLIKSRTSDTLEWEETWRRIE